MGEGKGEAAGVPDFRDSALVYEWLWPQPLEVSIVIAARAALRVLPVVERGRASLKDRYPALVLAVFRATAAASLSVGHLSEAAAVRRAANAALRSTAAASAVVAASGSASAAAAAAAVRRAVSAAHDAASYSAATADAAAVAVEDDADAYAARADAAALVGGASPAAVRGLPLWQAAAVPDWAASGWSQLRAALDPAEGWQVWIDWYEARLRGDPYDEALEECYVLIPEELWEQGPAVANAEIARRIAAYRERQAAALAQDSRGGRFVAGETGLALQPGDEPAADEAAAMAPHVAAALSHLLDRLRLSNRTPPGLLATVATLLEIVESGSDAARARAFEMWTQSLALAQGRARDDAVKGDPTSLDEPLDPDSRSALEVAVAAVAVYARAFDEVRRFDEALQGFDAPVAKPATQLAVVTGAVESGALERPSAEIVLKVVAVAEGSDQQGAKAKVGGFLTTRNLVYAAASVVLGGTLAGATGQVGADVAAEFEFSKPLIRFLRQSGEAIDDLLAGAPADMRQAVEAARAVQPTPRPSPPTPTPRPID